MEYRQLHDLNTKTSLLGFGCMRLPMKKVDGQEVIDEEQAFKMFDMAIEAGVNYFDTAYVYHNGFSEKVLGQIMENNNLRDKMNVATKMFTFGIESPDFDPKKMLDEQLERLKTDHIDFYLLHALHKERWEHMRDLGVVVLVTVIAYLAFGVVYALIYRATARAYYRIVSSNEPD